MSKKEILETIVNNSELKKFVNLKHWVSGSSTIVYPYSLWKNDIVVQLNCNIVREKQTYRFRENDRRRLVRICGDIVNSVHEILYYSLIPNDGSCPAEIKFVFRK